MLISEERTLVSYLLMKLCSFLFCMGEVCKISHFCLALALDQSRFPKFYNQKAYIVAMGYCMLDTGRSLFVSLCYCIFYGDLRFRWFEGVKLRFRESCDWREHIVRVISRQPLVVPRRSAALWKDHNLLYALHCFNSHQMLENVTEPKRRQKMALVFTHAVRETLHIPAHDHPHAAFDASLPCCWSIEQVWNVRRKKISTYQSQTPLVLTSRSTCFVEKMKNREMVDSYLLLLPSPPYWYPHQHMPIEACQHNKWRRRSRNDHFTHPKLSWSAKRVISTCGPCSSPLLDRTR